MDQWAEAFDLKQVRRQPLGSRQARKRLADRGAQGGERADGLRIEPVGGLVELHHAARLPNRVGEPGVDPLVPGFLSHKVDADQHDRLAASQPIVDVARLAGEAAALVVLAREPDLRPLDLCEHSEPADLPGRVYRFDLPVDAEVTGTAVPDEAGVRNHLVHEGFGPKAGPLPGAPFRHQLSTLYEASSAASQ